MINKLENGLGIPAPEQRESLEYKRRIVELFETGLDSDDIYAWHGTSWEAVQYLAENGRLPASGILGKDFYYAPDALGSYKGDQQEDTTYYANSLAADYYVLDKLPFQVKDRRNFLSVYKDDEAIERFIREEVIPRGVNEKLVRKLIREARNKRKGVLLTLSKRILDNYQEEPGDTDKDKKIVTKNGLPIEYITGIEPLGQFEWEELEKIQNEIK